MPKKEKIEKQKDSAVDSVEVANTQATNKAANKQSGKPAKDNKAKAKKAKNKKQRKGFKWFREMWSELKKVSWPTFATVCKQTGVVLAFILVFGVVLFGFDFLLSYLFDLLI